MDRYLLIDLGSEGIAIETAQIDFYASWLGIGLVVFGVIAYKIIRARRGVR